jgi:sulfite exporter TauE/SafE
MRAKTEGDRLIAACIYHGCRLAAYTLVGAVCGALGRQPLKWFFASPAVALPWALVGFLILVGTGLDKRIPRPPILVRFTARTRLRAMRLGAPGGAALIGLMTPLIPCGPLYAMFLTLMTAGSAASGMEMALAFGIGTVPLLWIAQHGLRRWRQKLPAHRLPQLQRSLALITALILAWRLHGTLPAIAPLTSAPSQDLPTCCH